MTRRYVGLGVLYLIWGSTLAALRLVLDVVPPLLASGVRFTSAGTLLVSIGAVRRHRAGGRGWPSNIIRSSAVVAFAAILATNALIALSLDSLTTGLASTLTATIPLWMVVFSSIRFTTLPARPVVFGVALGFLGVGSLIAPVGARVSLQGALLALVGAALFALGSVAASGRQHEEHLALRAGVEMLLGGLLLLMVGLGSGERFEGLGDSMGALPSMLYLVIVGSVIGFTLYRWLLNVLPLTTVSTYAYVSPLVAVVLGVIVLDESFTARILAGGSIILSAVGLIIWQTPRIRG